MQYFSRTLGWFSALLLSAAGCTTPFWATDNELFLRLPGTERRSDQVEGVLRPWERIERIAEKGDEGAKAPPEEKEPVWFFSKEHGFTEAPAHADTLRVHVALHPQHVQLPGDTKKKKKKGAELSPIVYNLPGTGEIEVSVKGRTLAQRTIPIAQIGIDVPLAKDLFTAEQLPVIVFNEKTGNIVSISK